MLSDNHYSFKEDLCAYYKYNKNEDSDTPSVDLKLDEIKESPSPFDLPSLPSKDENEQQMEEPSEQQAAQPAKDLNQNHDDNDANEEKVEVIEMKLVITL